MLISLIALFSLGMLSAEVRFGERPFIDIYKVPDSAMEQGHIRIKLSERYSLLAQELVYRSSNPESFGIEELDELNLQTNVTRISKVFTGLSKYNKYAQRHIEWGLHLWFDLEFDNTTNIRDIVMAYRGLEDAIQWAEPEYMKSLMSVNTDEVASINETLDRWTPNDTRYGEQWHYNNTGQTGGTVDADIDLPEAWNIEKGHPDVVVCIQDQGVQANHPDLAANMWVNSDEIAGNGIDDDGNGYIDDINGYNFYQSTASIVAGDHGCHVAGTVAGVSNNGVGIAGVAGGSGSGNGVRLMSTQVFGPSSGSGGHELAPIYGADNGAAISQNSWGYTYVGSYDQVVLDAIDYFNANGGGSVLNGGITIYAAGNSQSSGQWYPGCYSGTFAVAGTTHNDTKAWYSNYDTWVDVSAPGGETNSVTSQGVLSCWSSSSYGFYQGTSMACPHTSGVAALLISYAHRNGRTMTPTDVANLLRNTTDNHYAVNPSYIGMLGTGRINAYAALLAADPTIPSCTITAPTNNAVFNLNSSITINVTATDSDGTISNVKFYINDVLQNTDSSSPYSWVWNTTGLSGGAYAIKAVATDNSSQSAQHQISVTLLAPADEGFETGNFSAYAWVNNSSVPWTVQSSEKFSGTYAAKSGAIDHSAQTDLSLTAIVSTAGNISFYQKVSSESTYDFLQFFIDGVKQGEWSGSNSWTQQSYAVASGSHTFLWKYIKDVNTISGSDCAWIDHIVFPPMGTYYAPPQNLTATSGNGFVNLSWQAPAAGSPTGYKIFRNNVLINTVSSLTYHDTAVVNEQTYTYFLKAVYTGGESESSSSVNATPTASTFIEGIIGTGTSSNATNAACPINVYYQSLHGQAVYTASELNNAGIYGPIEIVQIGFNVTGLPTKVMPNYLVRMGHTSAANVSSWISTGLSTYWSATSYQPASTGWNMITLSTPFAWNGTSNIIIDTAFGLIGSWEASGQTQYTSVTSGYRYTWNDYSDQTSVFSGGNTSTYRPNLKVVAEMQPTGPDIEVTPVSLDFGTIPINATEIRQLIIENTGDEPLTGNIATPVGFTVAPSSRSVSPDITTAGTRTSRDTLPFTIAAGLYQEYNVTFTPSLEQVYTGNIVISSNDADEPTVNVWAEGTAYDPNQAPSIELPDHFDFSKNDILLVDFSDYVSDPNDDPLTLTCMGNSNIDVEIDGLMVTFSSPTGWVGIENVTFAVFDGQLEDSGDVAINSYNTPPWVDLPDTFDFSRNDYLEVDLAPYGGDDDGDLLSIIYAGNTHIAIEIDGTIATLTAPGGWVGSESVTFTVDDGIDQASDAVLIAVANNAPVLDVPDTFEFTRNQSLMDDLSLYASDDDTDPLVYTFSGNTNIDIQMDGSTITLSAPGGWVGSESVTFSADDGYDQASDTVLIIVSNTTPWVSLPASFEFTRNGSLVVDLSPYGGDDDGDILEVTYIGNTNVDIVLDGVVATFTAPGGWVGTEPITFTVDDGLEQAHDTAYIIVSNTVPTIELPASFDFDMGQQLVVDFSPYLQDDDGDFLSLSYSGNTNVNVSIAGMEATLSAVPEWYGTEIITFTVDDGIDQTNDAVDVIVNFVLSYLDPPVAEIIGASGSMTIHWAFVDNATEYHIYCSDSPDGPYHFVTSTTDLAWQVPMDQEKAFYQIRAINPGSTKK